MFPLAYNDRDSQCAGEDLLSMEEKPHSKRQSVVLNYSRSQKNPELSAFSPVLVCCWTSHVIHMIRIDKREVGNVSWFYLVKQASPTTVSDPYCERRKNEATKA